MALQVVSPAVSVYKVLGVKDGQEQVEGYTFKRGEMLPDWVTPFQQFTLTSTGMVKEVGDLVDPALVKAEDVPAPVVLPEHNPAAVFGTNVTGPMVMVGEGEGDGTEARKEATRKKGLPKGAADVELPDDGATKPVWEETAGRVGIGKAEAESMRKADLVAAVKQRKAEAEEARDLGGPGSTLPPKQG